MNIKYLLVSGFTAGALLFPTAAMASVDVHVVGNGAGSRNSVSVSQHASGWVSQSNWASVSNNVYSSSNTGHNSASKNTGGNVYVSTGDAHSEVNVSNWVNHNWWDDWKWDWKDWWQKWCWW